jgi:hypothetical protein
MIHLDLDETERQTLVDLLQSYLADMSYEIADTDRLEFREELKAKRDVLNKILNAVKQAVDSGKP